MKPFLTVAGLCMSEGTPFKATVVIDRLSGLIVGIDPWKNSADIVTEAQIYPGVIDPHVHMREDESGEEVYKEDFTTGGEAAANGGVTHVAEMGNNPRPPVDDESYARKETLTQKSIVPVTLYAMIGPKTNPLERNVPYKMCHARTTGKSDLVFFPNNRVLVETARRYVGRHVSHHCEDLAILETNKEREYHEDKRPPEAEVSAIERAINLTVNVIGRGKVCHCSVCQGIRKIQDAKASGIDITCEITPHHLFFDRTMITDENRMQRKMNPPLRSFEDRIWCIKALRNGTIDMLGSDHAPHLPNEGLSGMPHLDTYGPFLTWLMKEHGFTPQDIVRVACLKPAAFLNQFLPSAFGRGYGRIDVGYVGSLTILDPNKPITVTKQMLKTKCGWSPFEGFTFPGSVEYTIVRGKVLKSP